MQARTAAAPLYKLDPWAFAPRFGLAWDVTGKAKTVVRAGFNIIYEKPSINPLSLLRSATLNTIPTGLTLENGSTVVQRPGWHDQPAKFEHQPAASPIPWAARYSYLWQLRRHASRELHAIASPCSIGGVTPHLEYPMVLNWNFGVQHAITNSLTLDVRLRG